MICLPLRLAALCLKGSAQQLWKHHLQMKQCQLRREPQHLMLDSCRRIAPVEAVLRPHSPTDRCATILHIPQAAIRRNVEQGALAEKTSVHYRAALLDYEDGQ